MDPVDEPIELSEFSIAAKKATEPRSARLIELSGRQRVLRPSRCRLSV
jgi:hypothetical protein